MANQKKTKKNEKKKKNKQKKILKPSIKGKDLLISDLETYFLRFRDLNCFVCTPFIPISFFCVFGLV